MHLKSDVHYLWSSSRHCSMMSSQITLWSLWTVALRVAHAADSNGLMSGSFIASNSSTHLLLSYTPTFFPSLSLSLFPSHSRFSTAGCCSKAVSWRLDVWLPRWLKMLPQDPRENQEVVTSLRGELLSFSHFTSADLNYVKPFRCASRAVCGRIMWWRHLHVCLHLNGMDADCSSSAMWRLKHVAVLRVTVPI